MEEEEEKETFDGKVSINMIFNFVCVGLPVDFLLDFFVVHRFYLFRQESVTHSLSDCQQKVLYLQVLTQSSRKSKTKDKERSSRRRKHQ